MTTTDEALRVAREALEQISKVGYGLDSSDDDAAQADYWAGKAIHQRELARSALRTIALAAEAPKPEPCPLGKGQNDPDCTNRHQCWEPCGELGKSEDHVRVGQEPAAKFSPAVQSVALGEPEALAADEETVRAAIEAAQLTPNRDMDAYEALARLVTRASASGAVGETAGKARGGIYVECRECADCGHAGINDAHPTDARCGECGWSGPEPKEDRCPGCGAENVMGSACPKCSGRYTLVAEATVGLPGTSNGQENGK